MLNIYVYRNKEMRKWNKSIQNWSLKSHTKRKHNFFPFKVNQYERKQNDKTAANTADTGENLEMN